jgi:hypothetical protein
VTARAILGVPTKKRYHWPFLLRSLFIKTSRAAPSAKSHAAIAAKPTSMLEFFDTFDWQHSVLLGGAIIGGVLVGVGILMESEKWSLAAILVLIGITVEPIFTIGLFVYDEGLSRAQQSTIESQNAQIISLRTQSAPRSLKKEQFDAIQTLKGRVTAVNLAVEDDTECQIFASHLAAALMDAGIAVREYDLPQGIRGSGGLMVYDEHIFSEGSVGAFIFNALNNAKVAMAGMSSRLPDALVMPRNVPAILVYEKPSAPYISPPYLGSPAGQAAPAPAK